MDGTNQICHLVIDQFSAHAGDGQVLIKAKQPLARISGSVYVQAGVSFDRIYIKVVAPDVSWCTTTWDPSDSNLRILAGGTHVYDKLPYNCYVGAGWYGAIGPLAFKPDPDAVFDPQVTNATFIKSEFGSSDHACVGDDDASPTMVNVAGTPTVAVYSEHAQLSFIRTYRGYTQVFRGGQPVVDGNGNYLFGSQGIVLPVENNQPQPLWIPDHDFVLATINQADDGKCFDAMYRDLNEFLTALDERGELVRLAEPVSPDLEICAVTDRVSKSPGGGPALLFEQPTGFDIPVAANVFGSMSRMCLALGVSSLDDVAREIDQLMTPKIPSGLFGAMKMLPVVGRLTDLMPRTVKDAACQEIVSETATLDELPILRCWPDDGGRYITFPLVITKDPETGTRNIGTYRMQVFDGRNGSPPCQFIRGGVGIQSINTSGAVSRSTLNQRCQIRLSQNVGFECCELSRIH